MSFGAPALRVRAAQFPLETGGLVVLYNLMDMLLFGAFLWLAFRYRNRPELHKRWIIAATAALCGAALGRVVPGDTPQYLLLWLSPLIAMLVVDLSAEARALRSARQRRAVRRRVLQSAAARGAGMAGVGAALLRPFV